MQVFNFLRFTRECVKGGMFNSERMKEQIDSFDAYIPPLSPDSVKNIKSQYGAPLSMTDVSINSRPPTPGQSLTNASKYIEKMNAKGFHNESDMSYFLNNMYSRQRKSERRNSTGPIQRSTDLDTLYSREPYQQFWMTSEFAKKTVEEIRSLVFDDPIYADLYAGHFYDALATIVRVMKHRKMLDQKNAPRSHLKAAMQHFLFESHESRKNIIKQALASPHILLQYCPQSILSEFSSVVPEGDVSGAQQKRESGPNQVEKTVIKRVLTHATNIPEAYRVLEDSGSKTSRPPEMSSSSPTKIPVPALTERKPVRARVAIRPKESPGLKTKRRLSDYASFWTYSDPLATTRQGKIHPLEMVTYRDSDLSFEPIVEHERTPESEMLKSEQNKVPLIDEIWNTADLPLNESPHQTKKTASEEPSASSITAFTEEKNRSDAMKYLLSHDIVNDANGQESDALIHRQLERIWDTLGFSVQQKISLMLRYSQDPDSNTRFSNTLGYWDSALNSCHQYEKVYQDFKFFLKYEAERSPDREAFIQKYLNDISKAEEHVHQTSDILFTGTGDHLIYRKQLSNDLVKKRRKKLFSLIQELREN